jgi:hypothetical protein
MSHRPFHACLRTPHAGQKSTLCTPMNKLLSFYQDPVVTRIKRDQKIPIIGFVANTGGLLGLCMGFSLVSAFEIIYHCMMTVCWKSFHLYRRQTMRKNVAPTASATETTQVQTISQTLTDSSPRPTPGTSDDPLLLMPNGGGCNECQQQKMSLLKSFSQECRSRIGGCNNKSSKYIIYILEAVYETLLYFYTIILWPQKFFLLLLIDPIQLSSLTTPIEEDDEAEAENRNGGHQPEEATEVATTTLIMSMASTNGGGKQPPPTSLRKCVLLDNNCSQKKYSLQFPTKQMISET